MNTLLRIDASARIEGSHSRSLADYFLLCWNRAHSNTRVVVRDLAIAPIPHLSHATIAAFSTQSGSTQTDSLNSIALSDVLIAELRAADHLLVSSPLYNFNAPSTLKAYIDHIVRWGQTFTTDQQGYTGLLSGRTATVLTARGGVSPAGEPDGLDMQGPFLHAVLRFIGFDRVDLVALEGTNNETGDFAARLDRARAQIDHLIRQRG
ncbi:MAG: NAD(P)H-dependent oxidoreductase [Nitrospiraceae bacterium]